MAAPKVNPEILSLLSEVSVQRNAFLGRTQTDIRIGLSALGSALNKLLALKNEANNEVISELADCDKIFSNAHHLLSIHWRCKICSVLNVSIQKTARKSK